MKIFPACHQETFAGRATCHRCGSDVERVPAIELPSRDAATLTSRLPFSSKRGDLHIDIAGTTFFAEDGEPLLFIPSAEIDEVRAKRSSDIVIDWREDGRRRRDRFRVRWGPIAETRVAREYLPYPGPIRTSTRLHRSRRRGHSVRDLTVVRDRWLSALEMLLSADRYALGRVSRRAARRWRGC